MKHSHCTQAQSRSWLRPFPPSDSDVLTPRPQAPSARTAKEIANVVHEAIFYNLFT